MGKGQITLYIILGIVLLGLVALVLSTQIFDQDARVLTAVPAELEPLRDYVHSCMKDVAVDGLERIGAQGGYVDPASLGMLAQYQNPTESDALKFSEKSEIVIPFWYYLFSENTCRSNCEFASQRPDLIGDQPKSISWQLESYLQDELDVCLNDFQVLRSQGFDIDDQGEQNFEVTFTDEETVVYLAYPLMVNNGDKEILVEDYQVSVDVPLKKMYEYASVVTGASEEFHFLEKHMIEVISVYSGLSKDRLPPYSAASFDFISTLFWSKSEVRGKVQNLLLTYVPALQVFNSGNYEPILYTGSGPARNSIQRLYDNMVLPLEDPGYDHLDVEFEYINWPIYFNMNTQGEIIRPSSFSFDLIPVFGIQRYNNLYDYSFPVKLSVVDEDALAGEGYTFSWAIEGNVRNNDPMLVDFDQSAFEPEVEFASSTTFCNVGARNSGNISFTLLDGVGDGVAGAQVLYFCGDLSCPIGSTHSEGEFSAQFPICSGGYVKIQKEDFVQTQFELHTSLDVGQDLGEIIVSEVEEKEIIIKKIPVVNRQILLDQRRDLSVHEQAVISLRQIDGDFTALGTVAGVFDDPDTLRLVPGVYEVMIDIYSTDQLVVEPEERTYAGQTVNVPDERLVMDSYVSGGLHATEKTGYIEITQEMLDAGDTLVFTTIGFYFEDPKLEDIQEMAKIDEYSRTYLSYMQVVAE